MKKRLAVALLIGLGILAGALPVSASGTAAQVSVEAAPAIVKVGDRVDVEVRVRQVEHLSSMSFELSYDPTQLELARNGDNVIARTGPEFQYYGGRTIDETAGRIVYPLLYGDPMRPEAVDTLALTIRFFALTEGPASLLLKNIKVTNYVSLPVKSNRTSETAVLAAAPLSPVEGDVGFTLKSAAGILTSGELVDLNGNGVTDKDDVKFVLNHIKPVSFAAAKN